MSRLVPWLIVVSLVVAAPLPAVLAQTEEIQLKTQLKLLKEKIEQLQKQEKDVQQELENVKKRDVELNKQFVKVELRGTLREKTALGGPYGFKPGTTPPKVLTVSSKGMVWELDFGDKKELKEKADSLQGKTVVLSGTMQPPERTVLNAYPPRVPDLIVVTSHGVGTILVEAIDAAKD